MSQWFSEIIKRTKRLIQRYYHAKEEESGDDSRTLVLVKTGQLSQNAVDSGFEEPLQDAGHKDTGFAGQVRWIQPQSPDHTAVHRIRSE